MSYSEYLMQVSNNLVHDLLTTSSLDGLEEIIKKHNLQFDKGIRDDGRPYLIVRSLGKELYTLGDCFEDKDVFDKYSTPLLIGEVEEAYKDYNLRILTKEGLLSIIEQYHNKTSQYYKNLLVEGKENPTKFLIHTKTQLIDLCEGYNLAQFADMSPDTLIMTYSHLYEHAIFNLIAIYKFFDWDNNTLVFYGI